MKPSLIGTFILLCAGVLAGGCTSSGSGAPAAPSQVGRYDAAPDGITKPRLAMSAFRVEADSEILRANASLGEFAGDQMGELLGNSGRFAVISRNELSNLLEQQDRADILRPGAMVRPAAIDGVDYVLIGTISNLSITKSTENKGMMDRVTDFIDRSGQNKQVMIRATCGVGFSIVDPSTNDIVIANSSEYTRTAAAADLGIDVITAAGEMPTTLPVSASDREKIVRLAVDDAIRRSLPKIDRFLQSRPTQSSQRADSNTRIQQPQTGMPAAAPKNPAAGSPATAPAWGGAPPSSPSSPSSVQQPAAAKIICPTCGEENPATAKFCKRCGAKLK